MNCVRMQEVTSGAKQINTGCNSVKETMKKPLLTLITLYPVMHFGFTKKKIMFRETS